MKFNPYIQPKQNILSTQLTPLSPNFKANEVGFYSAAQEPIKDSFVTNPLYNAFDNKAQIEAAAKSNPRFMDIHNTLEIALKINMDVSEELKKGHMMGVRLKAAEIYSSLPQALKSQVNLEDIQQAAMLHDIGKIFIPKEILNKSGALTPEDWKIVEFHPELGYELLKSLGNDDSEVLKLIKYHHQSANGGGYPRDDENHGSDFGVQTIRAADIYCALTEKRPYKEAMSRDKALAIMHEDVESGKMSEEVYQALCKIA